MGIYPELDNLSLNELMDYWCREPIDGKEYAIVYYDEIAFLLSKQGESGREFLANELNQENSPEKLCAILGFLPSPEHPVLPSTLLKYLHHPNSHVIARAIDGLMTQREQHAIHEVYALYTHPSAIVRSTVLRFLSKLSQEFTSRLIEALQDPDPNVRCSAIDELDDLDVVAALPRIQMLLSDAHPHVREAAETALENLERIRREEC
jgi:hypothetical protein